MTNKHKLKIGFVRNVTVWDTKVSYYRSTFPLFEGVLVTVITTDDIKDLHDMPIDGMKLEFNKTTVAKTMWNEDNFRIVVVLPKDVNRGIIAHEAYAYSLEWLVNRIHELIE